MDKYITPEAFIIQLSFDIDSLLCSSPVPGGNEGLIYEDWGNGGN